MMSSLLNIVISLRTLYFQFIVGYYHEYALTYN